MAHCVWKVPLGSGNHVVEFTHGTTTGSRLLKVDGAVLMKTDWMFRLVGEETFKIGPKKQSARVRIEAIDGFTYTYKLFVGNKELDKFARESHKNLAVWGTVFEMTFLFCPARVAGLSFFLISF